MRSVEEKDGRLVASFGLMDIAALRPEEGANLSKANLAIPGEIYLKAAAPEIGASWTDSRQRSEARGLK